MKLITKNLISLFQPITRSITRKQLSSTNAPLLVIVGPTASGKSALAMKIARKYSGEIICSDSRTIYKSMDIGTGKPSKADQIEIKHWGLDLTRPGKRFTAADFKKYANVKIKQIRRRGNLPILVGGTGLYIDSIIFDYKFAGNNVKLRKKLENLTIEQLKQYCANNNIKLPHNHNNRRHLINAISRRNVKSTSVNKPIDNSIIVGIATNKDNLYDNIQRRSNKIFKNNVIEEAKFLSDKFGWDNEAMTANIYRFIRQYLDGEISFNELKTKNEIADRQLAKKQLSWLKRNQYINWLTKSEAYKYICSQLDANE